MHVQRACLNTVVQNQGLNSEFVLLLISRGDESHVSTTNVFFFSYIHGKTSIVLRLEMILD